MNDPLVEKVKQSKTLQGPKVSKNVSGSQKRKLARQTALMRGLPMPSRKKPKRKGNIAQRQVGGGQSGSPAGNGNFGARSDMHPMNTPSRPHYLSLPKEIIPRKQKKRVLYHMLKDLHPTVRQAFSPYPPMVQILAKIAIAGASRQTDDAFRVFDLEHLKNSNYQDLVERFRPLIAKLVQSATESGPYDGPCDDYYSDGGSDEFDFGPSGFDSGQDFGFSGGFRSDDGRDFLDGSVKNSIAKLASYIAILKQRGAFSGSVNSGVGPSPVTNSAVRGPVQSQNFLPNPNNPMSSAAQNLMAIFDDRRSNIGDMPSNVKLYGESQSDNGQFDSSQFGKGQFGSNQFGNGQFGNSRLNSGHADAGRFDTSQFNTGQFNTGRIEPRQFDVDRPDARQFDIGRSDARQFDIGRSDVHQFDAGRSDNLRAVLGSRTADRSDDLRTIVGSRFDDRSPAERSKDWRLSRYHDSTVAVEPSNSGGTKESSGESKLYREFFDFMSSTGRAVPPNLANDLIARYGDRPVDRPSGARPADRQSGDYSAFVYPRIGVTEAASARRLSRTEAEMVELALFKRITAKDRVKCHGVYREYGAVIFVCDDDRSARWLVKTVPFLLPWAGAVLKAEPWCKRLNSTELLFQLPPILSKMPWPTFCEKLQLQNELLSTSDWKLVVEEDTTRVCSIDRNSLINLKTLNFKAFLSFFQIEFKLISEALT